MIKYKIICMKTTTWIQFLGGTQIQYHYNITMIIDTNNVTNNRGWQAGWTYTELITDQMVYSHPCVIALGKISLLLQVSKNSHPRGHACTWGSSAVIRVNTGRSNRKQVHSDQEGLESIPRMCLDNHTKQRTQHGQSKGRVTAQHVQGCSSRTLKSWRERNGS